MTTSIKSNWLAAIIIVSSILITTTIIGIVITLLWTSHSDPLTGVTDTTVENISFLGARYIALPGGILNFVIGFFTKSRNLWKKAYNTMGILIGVFGILIGLLSWGWFMMVSAIVF